MKIAYARVSTQDQNLSLQIDVVVWKLDRLGRSLHDLIDLVSGFKEQDVE